MLLFAGHREAEPFSLTDLCRANFAGK